MPSVAQKRVLCEKSDGFESLNSHKKKRFQRQLEAFFLFWGKLIAVWQAVCLIKKSRICRRVDSVTKTGCYRTVCGETGEEQPRQRCAHPA